MPRRHRDEGATVESDSFLDIVANIVGILIILIVVAGVRVGQSAALPPASVAAVEPPQPLPTPKPAPVVAPRPTIVRLPRPESPPAPEPSPALLAAIDATAREIEGLRVEGRSHRVDGDQIAATAAEIAADISAIAIEHAAVAEEATVVASANEALAIEVENLRSALDGIGRQISDVPTEKVTVLRHRLNPIAREVRGNELHFRIAAGRIAKVPIEALVERLKPQIERQKDWIAKYHRQQGRVGPIDGFSMEYVVERQRLSAIEELRAGTQMMRITVTGWKAVPERDLVAESVEEALQSDSRFMSALRLADRNATLTFWVYPDSFEAYRRLQQAAHAEGLSVAARPLPDGVPIAGSPNGSRSSSQ
ncbi:MAG: hypothetical protein M3552_00150 [Planctomycetota bacterium]|nr:hypothetical protein [Planctomycetaceae bacterium]MDQ3329057.1 hypothetical protein [Planctomycetota bacterium]